MVAASLSAAELEPIASAGSSPIGGLQWSPPAPASIDDGLFARALRAAAVAWQPSWLDEPLASAKIAPAMALPEVLAAWRASERELAGITAASPDHVLLEANVGMLRAMYQRLYVERMRR